MSTTQLRPVVVLPGVTRVDIHRRTYEEDDEVKKVPYAPVGVSLGDGLVLDVHGNLSVLAPEALQQDWAAISDFDRVTIDADGWMSDDLIVEREENVIRVDNTSWGAQDFEIREQSDHLEMKASRYGKNFQISQDENTITIDDRRWGATDFSITRRDGQVVIEADSWRLPKYVLRRQDGQMVIESERFGISDVTLSQNGNSISIDDSAWAATDFRIDRDGDNILVDDLSWTGDDYRITLGEGEISVDNTTWGATDYKVTIERQS